MCIKSDTKPIPNLTMQLTTPMIDSRYLAFATVISNDCAKLMRYVEGMQNANVKRALLKQ